MLKKLGGSKQLPQPTPGPQPTSGPQPTPGQNLAVEVGETAAGLHVGGGIIPPPQVKKKIKEIFKDTTSNRQTEGKCSNFESKCDFMGKQGKEMEGHIG